MGRKYYKDKPYSKEVLEIIARHYNELRQRLCHIEYGNYAGRSIEDIFSETIIKVMEDESIRELKTDEEVIRAFEYRFKMMAFQIIKDCTVEKTISDTGQITDNNQEKPDL